MTKVEIALPGQAGADALALPVAQPLGGDGAKIVDEKLGGRLGKLSESGELRGERGEAVLLHLNGELEAPRLVAAGVGKRDDVDADALRTAGATTAQALSRVGGTLVWLLDESLPVPLPEQAAALVEGTIFGAYSPGRWKSEDAGRAPERIVVGHADDPELREAVERAAIVAERANRSRDLSNMPPNELTPHTLGENAQELAHEHEHLTCEILGTRELDELGMGALTAVGRGSRNEPRLIVLRYDPPGARDDIVLGLVGKSITFDAGGISIKPSGGMQDMKGDMSGGAGTLHGIGALAALGTPVRAIAALAAAENLPGGDAFRPGDILRAANGKTIEVINTDAEGRLVLADALWYVRREGATHVLDLATLTGAMELALGDLYAGAFANDDAWRDLILEAGRRSGDLVWPMPLHPRYRRYIDSAFADMKNGSTLRQGSPALAAEFLHEFAGDGPWCHVDMAGPGVPRAQPRRLPARAGRNRLRRPAHRRARQARRLNFELSDEQELIRRTVREFAETKVAPVAEELDREERFPYELVAELAELGLMGLPIPEEYGGAGGDTVSYAIAIEELTRIDSSVAITVAAHTSLGTMPILLFGNEEQKQEWLPRLASGQGLAAFGLTEPDAGSDAGATRTKAELRDGEWVIDGSKIFITNAGTDISACVTITARTGEDEISNLIVPNGTPGYEISAPMHKLGWHASDTRELVLPLVCGAGREPPRRARARLRPVHGDPRRRPHLGRGDGRRARAGRVRPRLGLREGAAPVRKADRELPGDPVPARRHGDGDRGGAAARLPRGVAQGRGQAVRARGGAGEALHRDPFEPRRELGPPDPRRLRVHGGVRDRTPLPRPEDPRDRRGHERGAAHGDRPPTRPLRRVDGTIRAWFRSSSPRSRLCSSPRRSCGCAGAGAPISPGGIASRSSLPASA